MDRRANLPGFIAMNDAALAKEAGKQQSGDAPTTTTTTAAAVTPTTTTGPVSPTTTAAPQTSTTTQAATTSPSTTPAPASTTAAPAGATDDLTDERAQEIALNLLRRQTGNPDLTLDDMVSRLQSPQTLTEEQKKKIEQEREQRTMKAFIDSGKGSMDDFFRLRELRTMKDEDLVRDAFTRKVKAINPKLSDKDVAAMFDAQYFIGASYDDYETNYGLARLKDEADLIRQRDLTPLSEIEKQVQLDQDAVQSAQTWKRTAQEYVSQLPKTVSIPVGKIGETEVGNFTYNLSDDELREHASMLENPAALLHSIRDEKTGKTDLKKLSELFLFKQIGRRAIKAAASEFYSKGVDSVASRLNNAPNLNTGGGNVDSGSESEERAKGEKQIREDSSKLLGRQNKVKTI